MKRPEDYINDILGTDDRRKRESILNNNVTRSILFDMVLKMADRITDMEREQRKQRDQQRWLGAGANTILEQASEDLERERERYKADLLIITEQKRAIRSVAKRNQARLYNALNRLSKTAESQKRRISIQTWAMLNKLVDMEKAFLEGHENTALVEAKKMLNLAELPHELEVNDITPAVYLMAYDHAAQVFYTLALHIVLQLWLNEGDGRAIIRTILDQCEAGELPSMQQITEVFPWIVDTVPSPPTKPKTLRDGLKVWQDYLNSGVTRMIDYDGVGEKRLGEFGQWYETMQKMTSSPTSPIKGLLLPPDPDNIPTTYGWEIK
jgi:hypothetical protein